MFLFKNLDIFSTLGVLDIYMKRHAVHSLLLALALVLMQACVSDITANAPKSAPPPKSGEIKLVNEEPPFMRGFSRLDECSEPQVGSLAIEDGTTYGSGVLITPTHVLTAGHCADTVIPYWFISGGQFFKVHAVLLHPNYKIAGVVFADIAVLTLEAPCPTTPSTLLSGGYQFARGDELTTVGYGGGIKRKSNPGVFWYYGTTIEEPTSFKFLPLDGTIWFGDSGGGVYNDSGVLIGIISSLSITRGHLFENSAVRLDVFLDWIQEATKCN